MQIDTILLGLLEGGDFFGYELKKIIEAIMVDLAAVSTGTLYYKLKKLEKKGYLTSTREQEGKRPPRNRYAITAAGRKELRLLILRGLSTGDRPYWPSMPGFFFIHTLPKKTAVKAVRSRAEAMRKELRRLQPARPLLSTPPYPFHSRMILEHGIRHLEADISWLEEFADLLEENSDRGDFSYTRDRLNRYMDISSQGGGKE